MLMIEPLGLQRSGEYWYLRESKEQAYGSDYRMRNFAVWTFP